jgi:hypothetical protein
MRTAKTFLFATALLLARYALPAQQQTNRSAAEALEIEQAEIRTGIPPVPLDEKLTDAEWAAQAAEAAAIKPVANPVFLRTAKDEKLAAQPNPSQRIPDPPMEESQASVPVPIPEALPCNASTEQPKTTEKPVRPADSAALEKQQHQQNGIRAIPAPPKEESTSNQH